MTSVHGPERAGRSGERRWAGGPALRVSCAHVWTGRFPSRIPAWLRAWVTVLAGPWDFLPETVRERTGQGQTG